MGASTRQDDWVDGERSRIWQGIWNTPQTGIVTMKTKTAKQTRYLLSKVSPLKPAQKEKLKKELHSGKVKIKKTAKRR